MADRIQKTYVGKPSPTRKEAIEVLRVEDKTCQVPIVYTVVTRQERIFVGEAHDVRNLIETLTRALDGK